MKTRAPPGREGSMERTKDFYNGMNYAKKQLQQREHERRRRKRYFIKQKLCGIAVIAVLGIATPFAPLLDLYFGQKTTITLWLCLHLLLHLRQRLLYVLLPVLGFMKKSHSCFAFFDNLGIVKTPFTCLNRERHFAPPICK